MAGLATLPKNFKAKVVVDSSGCWLWTGYRIATGYGLYHVSPGVRPQVHRYAYTLLVGPIPDGLQLDHLCHSRSTDCGGGNGCTHRRCVNPGHLEPVTPVVNTLRSAWAPAAVNARKTHCDRGHAFDDANTYRSPDGKRICKTCRRVRGAAHDAKRRPRRRAAALVGGDLS